MSGRIETGVARADAVTIWIDGAPVQAFPGETVLAVLAASGRTALRVDRQGAARGAWCNMGTCSECFVSVRSGGIERRLRACLTPIADGMTVETGANG
ncbi:(2Fe-2S)-binding protein [Sphingomonas nostoxanthinifaciens]|uniref:(2Fe-2S)-binding protein n=1 Tax=Sphingomonas nostoxanthinifaciens TaxID=2872652 RepID=UPI001CC1FCED|nr:(2Fe-2S)-binding protein [Sphingomonas nostoxanthinifaciens]UAK22912.1 (2Fe-2S)-binding protein [Sphingomonas nostoxanthinifaciens]